MSISDFAEGDAPIGAQAQAAKPHGKPPPNRQVVAKAEPVAAPEPR